MQSSAERGAAACAELYRLIGEIGALADDGLEDTARSPLALGGETETSVSEP